MILHLECRFLIKNVAYEGLMHTVAPCKLHKSCVCRQCQLTSWEEGNIHYHRPQSL